MLDLAKGLAQLLHAVSVHNDGMPAGDRNRVKAECQGAEGPRVGVPRVLGSSWSTGKLKPFLLPIWVFLSLFPLRYFLLAFEQMSLCFPK